jgi:tetratricopeptide (TPR) repeat protein/ADP-heptose:LPS heptosyltransferase
MRAGQHLDAQVCCQQALAANSSHADSLHLQGLLSLVAQQHDHAVEWIARAILQKPKPEYLASLGTALLQQGRPDEALKAFDKAVQLKPDDAALWMKLGDVLVDLKRPDDALLSFQHVLGLDPRRWEAAYRSGLLLHELGRSDEALLYFDQARELQPGQPAILEARADALHRLGRYEAALAENKTAYALNPDNANTCNNIGAALQLLGKDEEALQWFDGAVKLRDDHVVALINKASSLQQLRRFDEAVATYHHVRAIDPASTEPDWNLSFIALLTGNFEAGWAGREVRWRRPSSYPDIALPMWLGNEPLQGKTILIVSDEGLGDAIQFARYIPMLAERGARVVVAVQEPLRLLMADLPGVSECIPVSAINPAVLSTVDLHCPVMSLPLAFKTTLDTIPAPALHWPRPAEAHVQAWQSRLGAHDRLRVGLVWSGQSSHKNDHNRSLPLRMLARLLDLDATFVSLQKELRPDDQAALRQRTDIIDLTADLTDLRETAALLCCLDLVITVDTSVAHLAATLGRPTWVLLPYSPDYRWLLDRDDSPWYPTVRLFRQSATREYGSVLDRLRTELQSLISARSFPTK